MSQFSYLRKSKICKSKVLHQNIKASKFIKFHDMVFGMIILMWFHEIFFNKKLIQNSYGIYFIRKSKNTTYLFVNSETIL